MTRRARREAQASIVRRAQQYKGEPVTRAELAGEFKRDKRRDLDAVVKAGKLKVDRHRLRPDEYRAVPKKRKHFWQAKPDPWGSDEP